MGGPGGTQNEPSTPHAGALRRAWERIEALYLTAKGEGAIEPVFVVTLVRDGPEAVEWGERPEIRDWLVDYDPAAAARFDAREPGRGLTVVVGGPDGGLSVFHCLAPLAGQ